MKRFGFPTSLRVRRRLDYLRVQRIGRSHAVGRLIFCYASGNGSRLSGAARLGIVITRKQGMSVERNRFKRLVREVFRVSPVRSIAHLDLVVKLRGTLPVSFLEVRVAFEAFFEAFTRLHQRSEQTMGLSWNSMQSSGLDRPRSSGR